MEEVAVGSLPIVPVAPTRRPANRANQTGGAEVACLVVVGTSPGAAALLAVIRRPRPGATPVAALLGPAGRVGGLRATSHAALLPLLAAHVPVQALTAATTRGRPAPTTAATAVVAAVPSTTVPAMATATLPTAKAVGPPATTPLPAEAEIPSAVEGVAFPLDVGLRLAVRLGPDVVAQVAVPPPTRAPLADALAVAPTVPAANVVPVGRGGLPATATGAVVAIPATPTAKDRLGQGPEATEAQAPHGLAARPTLAPIGRRDVTRVVSAVTKGLADYKA